MRGEYGVVVVGGGPAGCMAAEHAALGGVSVLLVEKDREIGVPVRCAEGVAETRLRELIKPDPRWISNRVQGMRLVAPDQTVVQVFTDDIGYILDRKVFDRELARRAADAGAEILVHTYALGLLTEEGVVKGVRLAYRGKEYTVCSKVVIGADGVGSRVGRWAGLKTAVSLHDMETCAQYTMANVAIDPDYCEFHFGGEVAPGGYLWVFPKGKGWANVGVGISGDYSGHRPPFWYLDRFVARRFPGGSTLSVVAGGVPCALTLKELVADGLMLAGDAARQANPLTGAGIINGMEAGRLAGRIAAQAVREGDTSKGRLMEYQKEWNRARGKAQKRYYRVKEGVFRLTDRALNLTAKAANKIDFQKRTLDRIFSLALVKEPKLVLDAVRLFSG